MKLKTLLLGSATALAVAGGAQAADLTVAEPVDYVRVCDAFGTGYWYIPGTDVCLSIWGFMRFDVSIGQDWEDHYDFGSLGYLTVSAKSMTDWGPLEGYLALAAGAGSYGGPAGLDEMRVSLGPLLVGYTNSAFNPFHPGALGVLDNGYRSGWMQGDTHTNLVRLSWAMNGFGLIVELDEPAYGQSSGYGYPYYNYDSAMPDVIAALTASTATLDAKVSFVWSDYTDGWAVAAGVVIKLDSIAPGDKLLLKAAYGEDAPIYTLGYSINNFTGATVAYWNVGSSWSALASFVHYFAPNFRATITGNYGAWEGFFTNASQWTAAFDLGYSPAPTLWITPEIRYWSGVHNGIGPDQSYWLFRVRVEKGIF